jgi:hypothetical protein
MKHRMISAILRFSCLFLAAWVGSPVAIAEGTTAVSTVDFLNSIGVCVHVQHHQPAEKLVGPLKYTGIRNVRDGADGNFNVTGLLLLHQEAGVLVTFGPGSGAHEDSLPKTIVAGRELAVAGALLAIEGPNEPNNFGGITYQGQNSTKLKSWIPVAKFQRDLYRAVKSDSLLKNYPVFGVSEAGAEDDNVGLQFLTIPNGAGTLMPDGTRYADFLNCHNYVCGQIKGMIDNQATLAASTWPRAAIDHLYGNHGLTWRKKFQGYTESELDTQPKVTTETGWKTDNTPAGDDRQGKVLLNTFLAQYKAGWKYTFIYEFTDDADGAFGFYKGDLTTPRKAAEYLHNLTSILADTGSLATPGHVNYSIPNRPATVHDLLMEKSDGTFEIAVWGERVIGSDEVSVNLGGNYSVKVYDPTIGLTPSQTLDHVTSVPLTVSDHVLILELKQG